MTQQPDTYTHLYALYTFHNYEIPEYVVGEITNEYQYVVIVSDWTGDTKLNLSIANVLDYYASHQSNRTTANLAGHSGDPRMLTDLVQEAFDWFKAVNRETLALECDRRGMLIDPRGDE